MPILTASRTLFLHFLLNTFRREEEAAAGNIAAGTADPVAVARRTVQAGRSIVVAAVAHSTAIVASTASAASTVAGKTAVVEEAAEEVHWKSETCE
mmetsp:Transcript_4439/g.7555  ORF Transcript_4439/g.7555 Transcript_4439/m.7555 type:complete len:96 (-) Transcript_4439:1845-2132(-)